LVTFISIDHMPFELGEVLRRPVEGDVGVAALDERAPVAGRGNGAPDHALQVRQRAGLPVVVAGVDHFRPGGPFGDLEGAAARDVVLGVVEAPGVLLGRVLLDERRIENRRDDHRDVGERERVGPRELHAERMLVDRGELLGLEQAAGRHLGGGEAAHRDGPVEGPFHVGRRDGRSVVELGVLAQLERDALVVGLPALGELRRVHVLVVGARAVGERLDPIGDEAIVAVPRRLVARAVGPDAVDVEIVGPVLGDQQQRVLLGALREGARPGQA
jgi:hypothetical protein